MAGCGSGGATSAQSQNPAAAAAPASAPAQAPATTTTDNGPDTSNVKLAGTAVESNTGVQVTEVSKFGPLQYATQAAVPHAYFAACNQDYGTLTSTSGFAVVDLTLTEDTGSFPENVILGSGSGPGGTLLPGSPMQSSLALNVNGTIACDITGPETGGIPVSVAKGQPVHLTGYVLFPQALGNANPNGIPQADLNNYSFTGFRGQDFGAAVTVTGPQAARCQQDIAGIVPFATLPFTDSYGSTCKRIT